MSHADFERSFRYQQLASGSNSTPPVAENEAKKEKVDSPPSEGQPTSRVGHVSLVAFLGLVGAILWAAL